MVKITALILLTDKSCVELKLNLHLI